MFDSVSYFEGPNHERGHAAENELVRDVMELMDTHPELFQFLGDADKKEARRLAKVAQTLDGLNLGRFVQLLSMEECGHNRFAVLRSFVETLRDKHREGTANDFLKMARSGNLEYTPDS